jgi:hypothetical protein
MRQKVAAAQRDILATYSRSLVAAGSSSSARAAAGRGGTSSQPRIVRDGHSSSISRPVAQGAAGAGSTGSGSPVSTLAITEKRGHLAVVQESRLLVYRDVPADAWFAPYVSYVVDAGIAQGYRDPAGQLTGEFGVSAPVTYAEVLKMALEASGKTAAVGLPRNASARGTWAAGYVKAAEDAPFTVYVPPLDVNAPATRGAVVQTVLEVLGFPIGGTDATFTDVPPNHPYNHAIAVAAFYGFISGDDVRSTFRPDDAIDRAEVAKLIALARKVSQR